jgi:hypothetical protein
MSIGEGYADKKASCVCAVIVLAAFFCSVKKETPVRREMSPLEGRLAGFFSLCARDASSAARVVEKHDIVKMLSHFLRMDGGGKKYYLLEREHISEMILAVNRRAVFRFYSYK